MQDQPADAQRWLTAKRSQAVGPTTYRAAQAGCADVRVWPNTDSGLTSKLPEHFAHRQYLAKQLEGRAGRFLEMLWRSGRVPR